MTWGGQPQYELMVKFMSMHTDGQMQKEVCAHVCTEQCTLRRCGITATPIVTRLYFLNTILQLKRNRDSLKRWLILGLKQAI